MFEVIILSIVQGITEFLPISSSAHLIIIAKYFNFSNANLTGADLSNSRFCYCGGLQSDHEAPAI